MVIEMISRTHKGFKRFSTPRDQTSPDAIGSLRGHKDTFATTVNLIISYWFFALPIGIFLAFSNYAGVPNEAEGIWIGMIIGIAISAILNALRLKYKKKLLKKLY